MTALDPPQTSEADLVARLKAGDEDAAHEFFDRYAARIRRFIASSLGAAADEADDIMQETFIALADALPFFRGDSSLFTFACAIAHRKVLSLIRTNARRARLMRAAPVAEVTPLRTTRVRIGNSVTPWQSFGPSIARY